ncbi:vitamin B12 ABC transporter permease BtuC [Vibrio sp. SM6]|uniref:Vitamin B12 import system permease protein BtuC n=1 Tax=Vibrio agarilyticus TaxID=2726741 RepID=A0A7X8TQT3_9VIBR|nr:vitamin B12 ABC transporter permease BtuC [Vibrio agarilyticus]NLS12931.1 vitamin B12 ABC transporter permease BtuC [Vibrio agarilyticus]
MDFYQLLHLKQRRWQRVIAASSAVLVLVSFVYLIVGEVILLPWDSLSHFEWRLLLDLRLPRLLAAAVVGASLAVSGAALQVLLGNALAEPGVLGISGGASLAMVIVLFVLPISPPPLVFMLAAMAGAILFTLLLVSMARVMRLSTARLLLVGVALGILSSAAITWASYFSDELSLRQLMYWLMGSIGGTTWAHHWVTLLMLPPLLWLTAQGKKLDKLMIGEVHAAQLGIDVAQLRWQLIVATAILVGGAVSLGGVIAFVGLVVPHLLRIAFGSENRYLLPLSALLGATLVVMADIIARMALSSAELPLGVVTTTLGAPVFIWMLVKNHDAS